MADNILDLNRRAWNSLVENGNRWTVPVSPEEIAAARRGQWQIVLTPFRPVPSNWFPGLDGAKVLCLASGGGQQGPILAAAGAEVVVFDNSPRQLDQDRLVASRDGLTIDTIEGDMADLGAFADQTFDLIVHPISNCFVPDLEPVWSEAYRVLRTGGAMLAGFTNPLRYLFNEDIEYSSDLLYVVNTVPYSDEEQLTNEQKQRYTVDGEPFEFGHTLESQIGGQLKAGFVIAGFYEDLYPPEEDKLSAHIPSFAATRALKL
ncbi:MAG: class I SAM-dependent methyltransferase [Acidobacteriota bacterium]|nr:class I SAM-dependent methyltransferase [Acidobacteriota bacterium]